MLRCFAAIKVPNDIALYLSLQRGRLTGARWIDPANFHLTLHYFGDLDRHLARDLDIALASVQAEPVEVDIEHLDLFGSDKPRALFAKVRPTLALVNLQEQLAGTARYLGFDQDRRKFTPHITLARLKKTPKEELAFFLSEHGSFQSQQFQATEFGLFSSATSRGGGPYLCENTYPL